MSNRYFNNASCNKRSASSLMKEAMALAKIKGIRVSKNVMSSNWAVGLPDGKVVWKQSDAEMIAYIKGC